MVGDSPRARSSSGQSAGLRSQDRLPDGLSERLANDVAEEWRPAAGARAAVANYARLNAYLDIRDLEQEAAVAALEARGDWSEDRGTSRELWEAWRVGLRLSRFVAEQRAPVSLPKRKGESWSQAAASVRVGLLLQTEDGDVHDHPDVARSAEVPAIEERLDTERAVVEVRRILADQSEAARAVLLGEEKSAAVAERMRLPRRTVYEQTAKAMRELRDAIRQRRVPE